jgi:hypothetical protein
MKMLHLLLLLISFNAIAQNTLVSSGNLFDTNIAAVRLYNRALTASEVQQNFNAIRGRFGI